ncbi:hypothetical protein TanjilG_25346 [Lupinus angustifolius]|uniref:C2H2-type domain-containing protein n=1 Tax=Lupinus angustifolius TaxID=3871 RepID=A0A4P1RV98_LUPAN|nr:hypothetical protein TanjilG_25346 [Lupinus angustifolius]
MDFNPQNSEKYEHTKWSSSNDQSGVGQVIRSFTCAFCKRGFSNAQALGGHMNIHRRDRAKLRQSCEENFISLDISMKKTNDHDEILHQLKDHDHDHDNDALPLFIGRESSSSSSSNEIKGNSVVMEIIEEKKSELDLELRLGIEPQETPNLSTREFF